MEIEPRPSAGKAAPPPGLGPGGCRKALLAGCPAPTPRGQHALAPSREAPSAPSSPSVCSVVRYGAHGVPARASCAPGGRGGRVRGYVARTLTSGQSSRVPPARGCVPLCSLGQAKFWARTPLPGPGAQTEPEPPGLLRRCGAQGTREWGGRGPPRPQHPKGEEVDLGRHLRRTSGRPPPDGPGRAGPSGGGGGEGGGPAAGPGRGGRGQHLRSRGESCGSPLGRPTAAGPPRSATSRGAPRRPTFLRLRRRP